MQRIFFLVFLFATATLAAEPLQDPEAVLQTVQKTEHIYLQWLTSHKTALISALTKCFLAIAICCLILYLRKKYRMSFRLADLFLQPLLLFLTLAFCFRFISPVIRTLPGNAVALEMKLFYTGVTLIITWGIIGLIGQLNRKVRNFAEKKGSSLDDLTLELAGNLAKGTVLFLAILFIGQNIFQINISALLAGAGVIGLAVALASRDTLSNFFGTIVIAGDAPFRVGDLIRTGEIEGIVEHVGARSCRIRTEDESLYTIPNSMLAANAVCLISRKGLIKYTMELGLVYQTSPAQAERAIRILHEIADNFHGTDQPEYKPHIFFAAFAPYALNIRVIVWLKTDSFAQAEKLQDEINSSILLRFNEENLSFAYPTQTLILNGKI